MEWARRNMTEGDHQLAGAADVDIPVCASTADEAFCIIEERIGRQGR